MEAKQALAFVARRAGTSSMEVSRWRHVMSLELGWMPPGQAGRYIAACQEAGLLVEEAGQWRLSFDAKAVEIPRGFRPDPAPPTVQSDPARSAVQPESVQQVAQDSPVPAAPDSQGAEPDPDLFAVWLPKVAAARGEEVGEVLEAVERQQAASGGLLHAEPALLRLAAEAGLDVREAARMALKQLQA